MNKITLLIAILIIAVMTACSPNTKQNALADDSAPRPKALILYYSQTGATEQVAKVIKEQLPGADIEAIEAVEPYSGTYDETIQRCLKEQSEGVVPEIKPLNANIDDYDVVFIGYPVWFGTYARPIMRLLEKYDFAGKQVVPFCTFGSGGLEATTEDLATALPKAKVLPGYGVRNARIESANDEVDRFLIENGWKEGKVDALPEFSELQPVTPQQAAIFDKACGDYQFPLGTPITVGTRAITGGTEYKFAAETTDREGKPSQNTVYVIQIGDSAPEFTKVVR